MSIGPFPHRIELAEREVRRFREDVEEWSRTIEEMALSGSVGADLVAKANKTRLEWDAEAERVTNCEEANELLRYEYRKPWALG